MVQTARKIDEKIHITNLHRHEKTCPGSLKYLCYFTKDNIEQAYLTSSKMMRDSSCNILHMGGNRMSYITTESKLLKKGLVSMGDAGVHKDSKSSGTIIQ